MTALIASLVPLAVAVVSSLRWPTLRRRIRDHTALLKDLPPTVSEQLTTLLQAELDELVRRDQRRLDRKVRNLLAARRSLVTALLASIAGVFAVLIASLDTDEPPVAETPASNSVALLTVLSAFMALAVALVAQRAARASAKTERLTVAEVLEQAEMDRRTREPKV